MKRDSKDSENAIAARAAEWVARCDGGLSEVEEAELVAWKSEHPLHEEAFARFAQVWDLADRPRCSGARAEIRTRLAKRELTRRRRRVGAMGIATLLAVGTIVGIRSYPGEEAAPAQVQAQIARTTLMLPERRELPDGSIAEYAAGTELSIEFSRAERRVRFSKGEVHFNVVSDPDRPFIVIAGGVAVRAVGTQFAVRIGEAETSVLVTEGKVAVNASTVANPEAHPVYVEAGQGIAVKDTAAATPPQVHSVTAAERDQQLAWRRKRAEFSAAPLSEVVATVNRYNRIQFVIDDAVLAQEPLSGVFFVDDAEAFALLLRKGFGVEVEQIASDRFRLNRTR